VRTGLVHGSCSLFSLRIPRQVIRRNRESPFCWIGHKTLIHVILALPALLSPAQSTTPAILGPSAVPFYPDGQYKTAGFGLLRTDGSMAQSIFSTAIIGPHLFRQLCVQHYALQPLRRNFRMNFIPSHPDEAFDTHQSLPTKRQVVPVLSSSLLPAFTGRDFITTTESSATSHRVERP
jgi:hypothetical protein